MFGGVWLQKLQSLKRRSYWIVISITGSVVLFFQNCSRIPLEAQPEVVEILSANVQGKICESVAPRSITSSAQQKVVLMVDMSASNLGKWVQKPATYQGIDAGIRDFWSFDEATDLQAQRLQSLQDFVLNSCPGSSNSTQYAVVWFADGASVMTGSSAQATSLPALASCGKVNVQNPFADAATTVARLKALSSYQQSLKTRLDNFSKEKDSTHFYDGSLEQEPVFQTNYKEAMKCLKDMLVDDLKQVQAQGMNAIGYTNYFMTDGYPKADTASTCSSTLNGKLAPYSYDDLTTVMNCYTEEARTELDELKFEMVVQGSQTHLQPIYYSNSLDTNNMGNRLAMDVLKKIASFGSVTDVIQLATGQLSTLSSKMCSASNVQSMIEYQNSKPTIFNLTARSRAGQLLADSDMDGLADQEEALFSSRFHLNLEPNKRRSNGKVMDGVLVKLPQQNASSTCNATSFNPLGLNGCEFEFLKMNPTSVDTDKDGIPDLVELLSGTNPVFNDALADNDGDGVSNQSEVISGNDPFSPKGLDPSLQVSLATSYIQNDPVCSIAGTSVAASSWTFDLSKIPLVPVQKYASSSVLEQHEENENIFLIYYVSTPKNASSDGGIALKKKLRGLYLHVQFDPREKSKRILSIKINGVQKDLDDLNHLVDQDFQDLGEVDL